MDDKTFCGTRGTLLKSLILVLALGLFLCYVFFVYYYYEFERHDLSTSIKKLGCKKSGLSPYELSNKQNKKATFSREFDPQKNRAIYSVKSLDRKQLKC